MKKLALITALLTFSCIQAQQAFTGRGDNKFSVGVNIQDGGNAIQLASDFGLGENLSYGIVGSYILGFDRLPGANKPAFKDRFDAKIRINANLGSVLQIDEKLDFYPGLSLGLKNFGGHVGLRYFFTNGFGLFSEAGFPIAKYENKDRGYYNLNNQFTFSIGATFSM
jgi:hypothetical protein